jgi:hypothetical protein
MSKNLSESEILSATQDVVDTVLKHTHSYNHIVNILNDAKVALAKMSIISQSPAEALPELSRSVPGTL